jgi:hypothetical protein
VSGLARGAFGEALGEAFQDHRHALAAADAQAEERPGPVVPRLADTTLPDQIRVMVADLVAASPSRDVLDRMAEDIRSTRSLL